MKTLFTLSVITLLPLSVSAQETLRWTESDRQYLLENLTRTRKAVIQETDKLTPAQWKFKESPERWSINQAVEHMALWELLFDREISQALSAGAQPEWAKTAKPDSVILGFIMEEKPHVSTEYTKPFTFSLPMGLNEGKNNLAWWLKMREESITYLKGATEDLRAYYLKAGRPNVHQVYINAFGHIDRHLRQIRKIKQNPNYPK
jgi:hypothetical protein